MRSAAPHSGQAGAPAAPLFPRVSKSSFMIGIVGRVGDMSPTRPPPTRRPDAGPASGRTERARRRRRCSLPRLPAVPVGKGAAGMRGAAADPRPAAEENPATAELLTTVPGGLAPVVGGAVVRVVERLGEVVPAGAAVAPPHRPERPALGQQLQLNLATARTAHLRTYSPAADLRQQPKLTGRCPELTNAPGETPQRRSAAYAGVRRGYEPCRFSSAAATSAAARSRSASVPSCTTRGARNSGCRQRLRWRRPAPRL